VKGRRRAGIGRRLMRAERRREESESVLMPSGGWSVNVEYLLKPFPD